MKSKYVGLVAALVVALLGLGLYLHFVTGFGWAEWTGFGDYTSPTGQYTRAKTLWDLLELLIVPAALTLVALLFTRNQRENDLRIAKQKDETQLKIAEENQKEATLQRYFDTMTDLLIDKRLRLSNQDDEVRILAGSRTLSILRGLDGNRKGQVLQFLYKAGLINGDSPVIDMSSADLREVDLSYASLNNINLTKADLRKSDLHAAKLENANFYYADLDEVNLSWANLRFANLQCGLSKADLGVAKLDGAKLVSANLCGANLTNASLIGADLRFANLKFVNEFLGDLATDNVHRAVLAGADLSGCNLQGALVDISQLTFVGKHEGATMPDGTKFEEWIKKNRDKLDSE